MVTCVTNMALARRLDIHEAQTSIFRPILSTSKSSSVANMITFACRGIAARSDFSIMQNALTVGGEFPAQPSIDPLHVLCRRRRGILWLADEIKKVEQELTFQTTPAIQQFAGN